MGFQITLKEFFDYGVLPEAPSFSPDAKILVERYEALSRPDKKLLLAYLDGLQKIDYSLKEKHATLDSASEKI